MKTFLRRDPWDSANVLLQTDETFGMKGHTHSWASIHEDGISPLFGEKVAEALFNEDTQEVEIILLAKPVE
jgi:hypothetical protein